MRTRLKSLLIGKPLRNEAIADEKYGVLWGLPILASDAVSSVAYAGEQILLVLLASFGLLAYRQMLFIIGAILLLLVILIFSYRQTIENYPNGGGAYIVAKDNLGSVMGVIAGAALAVDYIMTVAVSVASGVEQIATAFAPIQPYVVEISVVLVILLMIGNLRGIRESSRIFGIPTYLFIFGMLLMIGVGGVKLLSGYQPEFHPVATDEGLARLAQSGVMVMLLQAFSNGCTALTGVEAVSNAVPIFKNPSTKNAKRVLVMLGLCILVILSGNALLAAGFHVQVGGVNAVVVQVASATFGTGFFYYFVVATTFLILILAANTAFSGFPLLLSLMSRDGYAPRQLSMRGDRLSYSNGIALLAGAAIVLLIVFQAKVNALIGLYAIGVFISFTLSQSGMFKRWFRHKGKHWHIKAAINGLGAVVTAVVVVIIAIFKFPEGAWVVVILLPLLVLTLLRVKRHYQAVARQLRIPNEMFATLDISKDHYRNRVIVPMDGINQASIRALRYAKTISDNVTAFSVVTDEATELLLRQKWELLHTDIPYIVRYSPNKQMVDSIVEVIQSAEYDYKKGDIITVILPKLALRDWLDQLKRNIVRVRIERKLLRHRHIVVATMPLHVQYENASCCELQISDEELSKLDILNSHYRNRVIVPMASINQASVRALRFAKTISDNVTAFSIAIDEDAETKLRANWNRLQTDIPYIIKYSPYRKIVEPLLDFIRSAEYDYKKGDVITVLLPQFSVKKLWSVLLHSRTRSYIARHLLRHKHIVVATMPFQLKKDQDVLGRVEYLD